MATVLRLKRLLSEDPAEAIVVHSKRFKRDDCEEQNVTANPKYFTLIGTIKGDTNEQIQELLSKANSTKSPSTYSEWRASASRRQSPKSHEDSAKRKLNPREAKLEKRLKIVSCSRPEDPTNDVDETAQNLFKLYDVIEEQVAIESENTTEVSPEKPVITCNGIPLISEHTQEMAYDLYYASTDDVGDINMLDNIVRIDRCVLDDEVEVRMTDEVSSDEGDEDSNDENNWKNEYPEEDDDFEKEYDYYRDYDDDEEEILDMIQSCNMKDETSNGSLEMSPDNEDHEGYDYRYSRYKLQMMRELGENLSSDDDSM